jgi:hypothetical protein
MEGRRGTYSCTASSILCGTTGDVDYLVFLDDLVVTFLGGEKGKGMSVTLDYTVRARICTLGDASRLQGLHRLR